jgi:phosphatidate cytidylyltransferase
MKTRIITAIIGAPILLGVLYLGGVYWQGMIIIIAGAALMEYFAMMRNKDLNPVIFPAYLIMFVIIFRMQLSQFITELFLAGMFLIILALVIKYPRFNFIDIAASFFGAFYIGYFLSFTQSLAELGQTFSYILLVFLLTWASDIGGYFFGRLWGKHKLAPKLSPGKTCEGAAGGVLLTIVLAFVYCYVINIANFGPVYIMLLGLFASAAAQVGDLFESAIKRYFEVKDSGSIIPGHGGVLDRFDSFLLVLPIVYFFLVVLV